MANVDISSLEKDPRLFLYTSLTAGSSHIITATSRLETILKANKIPFLAIDTATDEKARRLWQRRSQGKKLPGLVKDGFVLGDLEEVEEWNEFGELKENIGPVPATTAAPAEGAQVGVHIAPPIAVQHPFTGQGGASLIAPRAVPVAGEPAQRIALPGAAEIAAMAKAKAAAVSEKAAAASGEVKEAVVGKQTDDAEVVDEKKADEEKEEAETKMVEKVENEEAEKDIAVKSQTGQTSTIPALTTASGEVVNPITDTETSGVADAVKEVTVDDSKHEQTAETTPAESTVDTQEVTQEDKPEASAVETTTEESETPAKPSSLSDTTKAVDDASEKTQEQDAKAPQHASESVED